MKAQEFFNTHPVFRYEAFQQFMHASGTTQANSVRKALSYYHKKQYITRIRRGLYAVNHPHMGIDPYLVAAHTSPNAILAYHTALELHNLAYTTFSELTYLTTTHISDFSFQDQHYRPTRCPSTLINQKQFMYGVDTQIRQGLPISLTSLERTVVDVLDRPDLAGGWEEVIRSLDHLTQFNTQAMIDYTLLLRKTSIVAKVGYFLQNLPSYLQVEQHYLAKLQQHKPKQPYYLDQSKKAATQNTYIADWQLIIPDYLLHRRFEEPHADDI